MDDFLKSVVSEHIEEDAESIEDMNDGVSINFTEIHGDEDDPYSNLFDDLEMPDTDDCDGFDDFDDFDVDYNEYTEDDM